MATWLGSLAGEASGKGAGTTERGVAEGQILLMRWNSEDRDSPGYSIVVSINETFSADSRNRSWRYTGPDQ